MATVRQPGGKTIVRGALYYRISVATLCQPRGGPVVWVLEAVVWVVSTVYAPEGTACIYCGDEILTLMGSIMLLNCHSLTG